MGRRVEGMRVRLSVRLLIALLASAACSMTSMSPQLPTGSDIVIGVPNAATGDYNVEGPLTKQGYDLWADWTNARGGIDVGGVLHKVRLIYQDDLSQPQKSADIATQMLTVDKVQFLLSPFGSTTTAAVAAVAEQHKVPLVASNAGARQVFMQGFHYTFGILAPVDLYPAAALDWELSGSPKPTTIAVLTADDPASLLITQGTVDYANSHGIK